MMRSTMTEPPTDEQLVPALARGDERAIEELLARYWERAYKVAYQLTGDATAAEDVAQEAFVKVLRAAERFDPARSFRAWFFGILRNEASQHRRAEERRERREGAAARPDLASADLGDAAEAVQSCLSRLPAKSREALVLHYLEGFTHQEIADLLEWPRATVATRIRRGLEAIRASVQPVYGLAPTALIGHLRALSCQVPQAPSAVELLAGTGGLVPPEAPAPPPAVGLASAAAAKRAPPWLAALAALVLGGLAIAALAPGDQVPRGRGPVAQAPPSPAPPDRPADPPPAVGRPPAGDVAEAASPAPATETSREEAGEPGAPAPPGAPPAPGPWRWKDAERVVESGTLLASRPATHPLGLAWSSDQLWLATTHTELAGATARSTARLWRRDGGSWSPAGDPVESREGRFQRFFALGPDFGLLSGGGYGGGVWFYRVDARGRVLLVERLLAPQGLRLTVSTVSVESDRLLTVAVHEQQAPPAGNRLLILRSHNLGASWSQTAALETSMSEDWCRMQAFQWSELCLGRFLVEERGRSVRFLRSEDGARNWTSTRLVLADDLGEGALRLPLEGVQAGRAAGLVYLGIGEEGGPGRYYFARSADEGRTWEPGRPITPALKIDDASRMVQLAASEALIAFAFREVVEDGTRPRLSISTDGGGEWTDVPLGAPLPLGDSLVLASRGSTLVLTGLRESGSPDGPARFEVFVRELSR